MVSSLGREIPTLKKFPSAESSDLFGLDQMRFRRNPIIGTHASLQFVSAQEPISLRNVALAMNPLWLNRIEPGTFGGQEKRQQTHTRALSLDGLVMSAYPVTNDLTFM